LIFASGRLLYRLDMRIDSPMGPQQQQPQQQRVERVELEIVKVMVSLQSVPPLKLCSRMKQFAPLR
jgi:hypothetical protein